jgi:hypothetical protein
VKEEIVSPLYYQEVDVTVSWDSRNKWISVDWRNSPSSETVRKGCDEIFTLLVRQKATAVLNDNSRVTGSWVGASSWVAEEWFPRMIARGLKKFAWIDSPASSLSVISAKKSVRRNQSGVIRLFQDGLEAEKWLRGG